MKRGLVPMLDISHCRHPSGASPLQPENLKFIWSEEGDAVALSEGEEILAIIP
jgi:hypothetical protein